MIEIIRKQKKSGRLKAVQYNLIEGLNVSHGIIEVDHPEDTEESVLIEEITKKHPKILPGKEKLEAELESESDRIVLQKLITEAKELDPIRSAIDTVKSKIANGSITENARQEIRDEIEKSK